MKRTYSGRSRQTRYTVLRLIGIFLSGCPAVLMLITGIRGTIATGQPRMDVLLPAELFVFTLPSMIFVAIAAVKQHRCGRFAVLLPLAATAALILCQGLATLSGIASGTRPAEGPLFILLIALLVVYDLAAVAAPILGLATLWARRR